MTEFILKVTGTLPQGWNTEVLARDLQAILNEFRTDANLNLRVVPATNTSGSPNESWNLSRHPAMPVDHALYCGEENGVPIIVIGNSALFPDDRPATDDELERYHTYWTQQCTYCDLERGEHAEIERSEEGSEHSFEPRLIPSEKGAATSEKD